MKCQDIRLDNYIYVHFIICQLHLEAAPKTKHMESLLKSYTSKVCDSVAGLELGRAESQPRMSRGIRQLGKEEAENGKNQKPNPDEMWGNSEPDLDTEPGVRRRQGSWVSGGDFGECSVASSFPGGRNSPSGRGNRRQISWLLEHLGLWAPSLPECHSEGRAASWDGVDSQGPAA